MSDNKELAKNKITQMRKITDLTEQEIYTLTNDELVSMIRLRKAEEGIQLLDKPEPPIYQPVADPDKVVYSCDLFGDILVFEDIEEINSVVNEIAKATTKCRLDYDWQKSSSDKKFIQYELKKGYNSQWDTITTSRVYSAELYVALAEKINQNKKAKEDYEKRLKEYDAKTQESLWIESEIMDRYYEVCAKINKLESYCYKFKNDYLPLSGDNKEIAMNFLVKAFQLSQEEREYVLDNYDKK